MRASTARRLAALLVAAGLPGAAAAFAIGGDPRVDPSDFRITTFASGLAFPLALDVLPDGSLLVASNPPSPPGSSLFNASGELLRLVDADGDGVADGPGTVLVSGLPGPVVAIRVAGDLVFASTNEPNVRSTISVLRLGATPADPLALEGSLVVAFPFGWIHSSIALAVREEPGASDRWELFFNVGSAANTAASTSPLPVSGLLVGEVQGDSIYRVTVDDSGPSLAASGLTRIAAGARNAAGLAFQPTSGDLFFQDNGMDTPGNLEEALSADELNAIAEAELGGPVEDFGFPTHYIEYRTGVEIGSGGVDPLVAFQPIPPPNGAESEGANQIAFAPELFPTGLDGGVFVGFHGRFTLGGLANEENPLVYVDLDTGQYFHFVGPDEASVGHLDALLATRTSLFVADVDPDGNLGGAPTGTIYQIQVILGDCLDGVDNDGDGAIDHPADPGCRLAEWPLENPECQDGINNDPGKDALIDFDGGASAGLPPQAQTAPDPQCTRPSGAREDPRWCGLGFELALLLPLLQRLRARRRRADR